MVKSEVIYNRILCIDTLLRFNGVIPSLPEFQLKLVTLIEQLHKSLVHEGQDEAESESLCRVICVYLDRHIELSIKDNGLSWKGYQLENYLFGYDDTALILTDRLESLLNSESDKIFLYSYRLLSLFPQVFGHDDRVVELLSACRDRTAPVIKPDHDNEDGIIPADDPQPAQKWHNSLLFQFAVLPGILAILWFFCIKYMDDLY